VLAVAAVVFAALVSVLAVWALRQKDEAESQERAADAQALVAQAVTELDSDPQESLRLALEAWETNASDGALAAIRRALSESKVRAVMTGHTDIVWSSSFSPDGTKVVTASRDTTAIVWDAVTGDRLLTLGDDPETEEVEGHTDQVNSAVFTPDGTRIVTVSYDGTARVWDATTGEASLVLPHDGEAVFLTTTEQFGPDGAPLGPVAFSPDGGRLVTYTGAGTVRVWDVASGQLLSLLGGPIAYSAAFSSDGTRIVTAHDGSVARIWDAANGTVEHRLDNQAFWSWGAAFSPDGSLVAVGNNDGTTGLFAVATGELERWLGAVGKVEFGTGHPGPVQGIAFSPDGRLLLTFGDKSARVWEVKSGRQIAVIGGASYVDMAAFSPDGGYVVTANQDATARVSEARTGGELMVLRGHQSIVWSAQFSSDGNSVVTASEDGTARVWSVDTGLELRGHVRPVLAVGFSPNGDRVVTSSFDETARIWDSKSGEEQAVLVEAPSSVGYTNTMWSASWHRDGVRAVTAEDFGTVRIWRTNEEPATFEDCCDNQGWPAEWAEFSASGDRVLVVYGEAPFQTARIWELDGQGQWVEVHVFDEGNVSAATFSPDGSAILTADRDLKEAQLWDATTFESIRTIDTGLIVYVDFSPDGQRVVTAGTDRIVRVWNIDTGELVHELPTPAAVATVAYSPDGRWIVAGGSDGATRVWDAETGQILAVLRMHADSVASVDVGVDGRILSGSDDRTAKIYGCSTCVSDEDLIEQAREQAAIGT
jgi:WD40 repeat protein